MCEDHQSILFDDNVTIRQAFIQFVTVLIKDIAEGDSNVSKGDNYVASNVRISRRL